MFTVEQIKASHSKVKSGSDFPAYIKEIKELGVINYETYVTDGHTDYHGFNDFIAKAPAVYHPLVVASETEFEKFQLELGAHQQGKTDYLTFVSMCAACGVEKWTIDMANMTCTYFDTAGNEILSEKIPE